jgi:excisionase family DNA binding protein
MAEPDFSGRLALTVTEAAATVGLKPQAMYRLVARGEIPSVRLGGRILILLGPFKEMFAL